MANERTFLAWIRTSIAIMAFGFVVAKFSLSLRQLYLVIGKEPAVPPSGISSMFGAVVVAFGALTGLLSFVRYKKVEKQIDEDTGRPALLLDIMITLSLLSIATFLIYLIYSI
jgi:putative membrane protein